MKRGVSVKVAHMRRKQVLLLACEWTPATAAAAREFQRKGRMVHVVTIRRYGQPETEARRGLVLHGIAVPEGDSMTIPWRAILNTRLAAMGSRVLTTYGKFDLLVACDEWVADGAALLAEKARLPIWTPTDVHERGSLSPMEVNG